MNTSPQFMATRGLRMLGALCALSSAACSKNGNNPDAGAASCSSSALQVVFAPMYSAYDGTHMFQVPAIVIGVDPNVVKWSSSDNSIATVTSDSTVGGGMITVTGAGQATIIAQAGGLCGSSMLSVTSATSQDWQTGSDRYNNGVMLGRGDGGSLSDPACTSCHGPTANGAFMDVAHTPEQTGGYSDTVIANIITDGVVPDGGYFDTSIIPYNAWHRFHHWTLNADEVKGVIVYLRSLTPTSQTGSGNFGGRGPGGPPDGGFHHMPHDMGAHD